MGLESFNVVQKCVVIGGKPPVMVSDKKPFGNSGQWNSGGENTKMHILLGFDKTLQQWVNSVMYKSINVYEGNPFFLPSLPPQWTSVQKYTCQHLLSWSRQTLSTTSQQVSHGPLSSSSMPCLKTPAQRFKLQATPESQSVGFAPIWQGHDSLIVKMSVLQGDFGVCFFHYIKLLNPRCMWCLSGI